MQNDIAIALDLDGTVTKKEILPEIAKQIDLFEEISLLTDATIKGYLPFEKSFRLRCHILKDVPVSKIREITRSIPLNSEILDFIKVNKKNTYIISGNLDIWIQPLLEQIGCNYYSSNAIMENDYLVQIPNVLNKADAIRELKNNYSSLIVVGEGMNDVPMFEEADIKIAYGGVHTPNSTVRQISDYVIYNGSALCRLLDTLL